MTGYSAHFDPSNKISDPQNRLQNCNQENGRTISNLAALHDDCRTRYNEILGMRAGCLRTSLFPLTRGY
jgi:hypothetical protein